MNTNQLVLYRKFDYQELFSDICDIIENKNYEKLYESAYQLIELSQKYGFEGNLWHCFIAFCLANNENAYSKSCEIRGNIEGTLNDLALHDFAIIKKIFDYKLEEIPESVWGYIADYSAQKDNGGFFNKRVRDRILELAKTLQKQANPEDFKDKVTEFYKEFGVGKFGLNKAFRISDNNNDFIEPITRISHIYLDDLVGYEIQKKKLIDNTEAFLAGIPSNNVLLYGDAGTGKSSCIKAIVNHYYEKGLRIIEVYKHQFQHISDILEQVKDRNYKFIIFMDDLSFEDSELEYKYLKALLEGGLGKKPDNVLIYATSNRRHLIRESFKDKEETDEQLHTRDTVQEKLSLAARFGVSIYFGAPNKNEFNNIVNELADRNDIRLTKEELSAEANKWELSHGGLSGRTANQFISYLMGQREISKGGN